MTKPEGKKPADDDDDEDESAEDPILADHLAFKKRLDAARAAGRSAERPKASAPGSSAEVRRRGESVVVFPEVMTINQVAAYLQMHPQVIYRHVRAGALPAAHIGRTLRFKRSVLDQFMEKGSWEHVDQFVKSVERSNRARKRKRE